MNTKKPILIVAGEPFSIFSEILFKSFVKYKIKRPLVILASIKLFKSQMNYLKYNIHESWGPWARPYMGPKAVGPGPKGSDVQGAHVFGSQEVYI